MQTNILWTGREYYSLENCLVNVTDAGSEITSTIVGRYQEKIYRVEYRIKTNQNWETVFFEIKSRHSNKNQLIGFEGDGKGNFKNVPAQRSGVSIRGQVRDIMELTINGKKNFAVALNNDQVILLALDKQGQFSLTAKR